jgi:hypothetical protein
MSINLLNDVNNTYPLCVNSKESTSFTSGLELGYVNSSPIINITAVKVNYNPNMIMLSMNLTIANFTITSVDVIRTDVNLPLIYRPIVPPSSVGIITVNGVEVTCKVYVMTTGKITIKPLASNFAIGQVVSFGTLQFIYAV